MFSLLSELTRNPDQTYSVILIDEETGQPRQYRVRPRSLLLRLLSSVLLVLVLVVGLVCFTPLREFIPGYGSSEMKRSARLTSLRLAALQDSLVVQQRYVMQLRQLMLGQIDSTFGTEAPQLERALPVSGEPAQATEPRSKDWADHEQPALSIARIPGRTGTPVPVAAAEEGYDARLPFPLLPPISGFLTRGFDARTGHYAADIAVEEGTMVRSIADGHVVFADWTQEGGFAIAVQHVDGYLSVYKHNQRLLKRVGDRVRDREAIAISGNSGEITTGPHLHFELWHNGLAQDPRSFFIGW